MTTAFARWCALLLAVLLAPAVRGAGTVTNATTAALLQALTGGGSVQLNFSSTLTLEVPLVIGADTVLEGSTTSGRIAVLSGAGKFRLFHVLPGIRLELRNLELREGLSTNGGAVRNDGILLASNVTFTACKATGANGDTGADGAVRFGFGDDGKDGADGIAAAGGAVYSTGEATFLGCVFKVNEANGGAGGAGGKGGVGVTHTGHGGAGGTGAVALGGAISSLGRLVVSNGLFSGNVARGGDGGAGGSNGSTPGTGEGAVGGSAAGGAIHSAGTLWLAQSSFTTNLVSGGDTTAGGAPFFNIGRDGEAGGSAWGGAVASWSTGVVVNTTFYTNLLAGGSGGAGGAGTFTVGNGGDGGSVLGAGIHARGRLAVTNVTFAWNTGAGGAAGAAGSTSAGEAGSAGRAAGSGLAADSGTTATAVNTIFASVGLSTVDGPVVDSGHNLFTDEGARALGAGSLRRTDPLLAAYQVWSIGTPGCLLLSGSPAADAADVASAPPVDQRGLPRPGGLGPDIGALEVGVSTYRISGKVWQGETGLGGVAVLVGTNRVVSGADGRFAFDPLPAGFYTVAPEFAAGFTPRLVQLSLEADVTDLAFRAIPVTMQLEHGTVAAGDRVSATGVAGVVYRLEGSSDLQAWQSLGTVTADAQGRLAFEYRPGEVGAWYYRLVTP